MFTEAFSDYKSAELEPLVKRLTADYYTKLQAMCSTAAAQAKKLKALEVQQPASHYLDLCSTLTTEVLDFIQLRTETMVPYILTLHSKNATGHDCTNCAGGCNMQHELKLMELKKSHAGLKDILNKLQMAALPLYSETLYPDAYRVLRNHMALIENGLMELYYAEEAYLIPKVGEAQMNINARN